MRKEKKINFTLYVILIMMICLLKPVVVWSQIILINEMPRALYYERTMRIKKFKDMKSVGDIVHSDKFWMRQNIISGNISTQMGRIIISESESIKELRVATAFHTRIRIIEEFYFNTTFYKDFNKKAIAPWTSDFSYAFGRYNWRPGTFSYGYENYENNKFNDKGETLLQKMLLGSFFLSYNNPNKALNKITGLDSSKVIFMPFLRYAFNYRDANESIQQGKFYAGKPTSGIALRYNFYKGFYIEGATYFYLSSKHKQPWDPDYTYGFGYFDWRPFRVSVTYGNWIINRFPWNKKIYPDYGFPDGNFKLIFNYSW